MKVFSKEKDIVNIGSRARGDVRRVDENFEEIVRIKKLELLSKLVG